MLQTTSSQLLRQRRVASASSALSDVDLARICPSVFAVDKHSSRSERFTFVSTADVIAALRAEGFLPFAAKQGGSRIEGKADFTKHLIRFRRADTGGNGESVPEIILKNAHDGTSAFHLMAGIFRFICMNGLIVAESLIETVRIGHTGNILPQVIEGAYRVLSQTGKAMEAQQQWARITLEPREALAFAEAAHEIRFPRDEETGNPTTPITADQLLSVRRYEDQRPDLWTTFNVVQENCIAGGLRGRMQRHPGHRRGRRVTTRAVNGIDQDVKLNRALWALGEKMAAIKAAN